MGFDSILFPDHYMSPWTNVKFDTWSLIAYLAGKVSKIRLGTCVTPIPLRHPSVLAKIVATTDILSGGRVILGVGAGWVKDEFVAYVGRKFDTMKQTDNMVSVADMAKAIARGNRTPEAAKAKDPSK